jgi:integrase
LFALRASDIEGQLCHISRSKSVKAMTIGPTKSGKSRTVTIPPVAQDALRALAGLHAQSAQVTRLYLMKR